MNNEKLLKKVRMVKSNIQSSKQILLNDGLTKENDKVDFALWGALSKISEIEEELIDTKDL